MTPSGSELSLTHLHDRVNELDSRVVELRSTVLTKDGYVDRRNREDEHIRHEFQNQRAISQRIDLNVVALRSGVDSLRSDVVVLRSDVDALRSDVNQIKTSTSLLKSSVAQVQTEAAFLREDIDRLQKTVDQLQTDIEQMRSDACAMRIDISKLQTMTYQLRTDFLNLEHKMSHQFNLLNARMEKLECDMGSMVARSRVDRPMGLNSLAVTVGARVHPVPLETDDGLKWPQYSPRTVWKFWCLKKRSRSKHCIEDKALMTYLTAFEQFTA